MHRLRRQLALLGFGLTLAWPALAWNAAGHRLTALVAWQVLSPASRDWLSAALRHHPDHPRWVEKSGTGDRALVFAEAATWPDSIRHDPRFHDERHEAPGLAAPGLPDWAQHRTWHYVDFSADGERGRGELDRQIGELTEILRSTAKKDDIAWAFPWLAHLVGDIHQPFHVGYSEDAGGNDVLVENPAAAQPFIKLHAYWDNLPGPSGLRGKRLQGRAEQLLAQPERLPQATVSWWLAESRQLLPAAYPTRRGSVSLLIDETFDTQARHLADQRLLAAGRRLGGLIEATRQHRVSRGTP